MEMTPLQPMPVKPKIVFNESAENEVTHCQPNYRKWERIWKTNEKYKTFDPNTYYHSKGWFGTPDPEPCNGELKTTAAKLYCNFRDSRVKSSETNKEKCTRLYQKYKGGKKLKTRRKNKRKCSYP